MNRERRLWRGLPILILSSALLVSLCVANQSAWASGSGGAPEAASATVAVGVREPITGLLLPYVSRSTGVHFVLRQQFATLLHLGARLQLEPEVVQKWWYEDGGREVFMTINPHAVWSDGTPITAEDVALCVNFLASPTYNDVLAGAQGYRVLPIVGAQAVLDGNTDRVSGFHVVNAREFSISLTQADPSVLATDLQGIMPLPAQILGNVPMAKWASLPFAGHPTVGSGPFLVTSSPPGEVVMVANPTFVLGAPQVPQLTIKEVPPVAARGLLLSGALDVYSDVPSTAVPQLAGVNGAVVDSVPGNALQVLAWNDAQSVPGDRLFRQAVMYALDRAQMIASIFGGEATLANGPLPPDSEWADPSLANAYPYEPQEARDLLIKAGFTIGNHDWLVSPSGAPFSVTICYGQGDPYGKQVAQAIANDLRAIAIDATTRGPLTARALMDGITADVNPQGRNVSAYLVGYTTGVDPDPRGVWGSQDVYNEDLFHWTNQADPTVQESDQLIAQQVSAADDVPTTRAATLDQWQALLSAAVPVDFLFAYDRIGVTSSRMEGVEWSGLRGPIDTWKWRIGQP